MAMRHYTIGIYTASLLAACESGGRDATTLNHYDQEMMKGLDDVELAASSHAEQVLAESDASKIGDLERAHLEYMDERMAAMQDAHASIGRCTDEQSSGPHGDGWQSMHEANAAMGAGMDDILAEMQRHAEAMHDAPDLASMRDEEHAHRTTLDELIGGMRAQDEHMMEIMHGMEADGASMMCSMMSHMHGR